MRSFASADAHIRVLWAFNRSAVSVRRHGPFCTVRLDDESDWQEKSYLGGMDGIAFGCLTALLVDRLLARRHDSGLLSGSKRLMTLAMIGSVMMFSIALWPPL